MTDFSKRLFQNVDGASLAVVRILFGVVMFAWSISYLVLNKVHAYYVEPAFHFKYEGFAWVSVAPEWCMTAIFLLMSGLAILITIGWFYRISASGFALLFLYVFLIDKTTYQNHYYFVCLMSVLMALTPANSTYSVDAFLGRTALRHRAPQWSLWLLRFQVGVVYFFGGVAKISPDWLRGFPMREMLAQHRTDFLLGRFAQQEGAVQLIVWGGLFFDLLIVPCLLWKRTRKFAFCLVVIFHATNSVLFPIGIFPWIMIALTTIFLEPNWPRQFRVGKGIVEPPDISVIRAAPWRRTALLTLLAIWCVVQVTLPLRHWLYPGNVNWTERGHYFAWHMMLRGKTSAIRFHIYDAVTGRHGVFPLQNELNSYQLARMSRDPQLIRAFSQQIERKCRAHGFADVEVRAFVLCSLNGRRPQLLISPNVDLTSGDLDRRTDWILPLAEPLPNKSWNQPIATWEQLVMADPLNQLMSPQSK
ncbi:HTTM domain-containing protein [Blastopirellula marina]|uniref:Vitamin K-dependent gamma-carboxylase n=1 Tax=Blastopirellula marina DSM 3645 TaxID=314230 RepID=A3ZZB4_9BACT|nr:HTTM domain-containing protein [Blastopirellula marina]EAQ78086.1 Vitamin K-dependent gamma-carboxylase [Blastopirellula marina DSM 3645]